MKKRYNLSLGDITFIEIADVFITLWIVGLFLTSSPARTIEFIADWKWGFFVIALIIGIKPLCSMLYGEKGKNKEASQRSKKKSSVKKKK